MAAPGEDVACVLDDILIEPIRLGGLATVPAPDLHGFEPHIS